MNSIDVSVIIATKNEERHIPNCLQSVKRQSHPQDRLETIVVDNNSIDKTKSIASQYADHVFNWGPERSAQRNFGISHAIGKYILYLDADMVLSKGVISECVYKCENEGAIGLYIPEKIVGKGLWIKVRDFERSFYNATCIDAVRFVLRKAALKAGGFDECLTGTEDWDFSRRLKGGARVDIIKNPLYHNEEMFNFRGYFRKKNYYAKSFAKYSNKWHQDDEVVKKQLGFYYRYYRVFFEMKKWKKLTAHPVLSIGLYVLRVRLGLSYLMLRSKKK